MLLILARQRRRILLLVLCLIIAIIMRVGPTPLALLAIVPGIGLPALVIHQIPHRRKVIEAFALSILVFCSLPTPDIALIFTVPIGTFFTYHVIYGHWWDRTALRIGLVSARSARLPFAVEDAWATLVPGEGRPEEHWTGSLLDAVPDPDDRMTLYIRENRINALPTEATVTFVEWVFERSCRYIIERHRYDTDDEATVTLSFDAIGDNETIVESLFEQRPITPRLAIYRWLEDDMGDEWDHFPARVKKAREWQFVGLRRDDDPLEDDALSESA